MAKATSKAKARAQKDEAASERKRKAAAASTLVAKQDIEEGPRKKAKNKQDMVDERMISKIIRDNFKGWSTEACELTIRDGMSLRQRLSKDKALQVKGLRSSPMGKLYYTELRALYSSSQSAEQLLEITNPNEPEDGRLMAALEGLFARRKNYEAIESFLACAEMLGQKSTVALFKGCLMFNPASSREHNNLAMSVLEYCKRHDLKAKYPTETGAMRGYFESALVKCFLEFRKHDLARLDFWHKYQHLMDYVLPAAAAAKCFECRGEWADVEEHLAVIVESGELGRVLFGKAWGEVAAGKVTALIKSHVAEVLGKPSLTTEVLQGCLQGLSQKVKGIGKDLSEIFAEPKSCAISYLGANISVSVSSPMEEYNTILWARIKEWGILQGRLLPIWGEGCLLDKTKIAAFRPDFTVDEGVINEMGVVRKLALSHLSGGPPTSALVSTVLQEHGAFLVQMDKRFKTEMSYFEHMVGDGSVDRLKDEVRACLPSSAGASASDAAGRMSGVAASALFRWCGLGAQTLALSVLENVRSLAQNKAPAFGDANDPFLIECREKYKYFITYIVAGEEGASEILVGKDAAAKYIAMASAKKTAGSSVMYSDIAPAIAFAWLLDDASRRTLSDMTKAAATLCPIESSEPSTPAAKRVTGKRDSGKKMVSNLFKNTTT